ncbi:hypothetical protein PIB30_039095 [Stylosanthes scabra]|uniref:Uncharacterized protein n=1 Tax=Stylosanthes scabra TaxID=79078 RepID=A0ABU6YD21_9FABA|nr:hypothetical protein [Stylosanthes scabra]
MVFCPSREIECWWNCTHRTYGCGKETCKFKPVIKKAMVELEGHIQFTGPGFSRTLLLEVGAQA